MLREVLRHYHEFEAYCSQHGVFYIEHKGITLSFPDLQGALSSLSPRKKEAVVLNVIYDMKQKDVAERMGITTVSVGQYVEQAMLQIAKKYFGDDEGESRVPAVPRAPRRSDVGAKEDTPSVPQQSEVAQSAVLEV